MQEAFEILSSSHRKSLHCNASAFTELEPKYKNIRSCNQSIYLFMARESWESDNFDGKLHLRKQIKIQLRGMSMSINHKHKFIS